MHVWLSSEGANWVVYKAGANRDQGGTSVTTLNVRPPLKFRRRSSYKEQAEDKPWQTHSLVRGKLQPLPGLKT